MWLDKGLKSPISEYISTVIMLKFPKGSSNLHESSLACVSSLWEKAIWKTPLLWICEILGVFINTLNIDHKYPVLNCEDWSHPIQVQLSEKRNHFLQYFVPFLEFRSNFKHFEKKMIVITNPFEKIW